MNITLNIGLNVSRKYLLEGVADMQYQYEYVKEYLNRTLGKPMQIGTAQSASEETVIVQYSNVELVLAKLHRMAYDLNQDYIAYVVKDNDGNTIGGALVGEYAHEWNHGIFNKTYFFDFPLL